MKKIISSLSFLLISFLTTFSQDINTNLDQNPASLRWKKIQTPHFKVIFPSNLLETAQKTANTLEIIYSPVSRTLGREPRPLSVILQNQTSISNGFVSLFPRRSEFFITPPQDYNLLGTNNWLEMLSIHEFRHVVQNDKALVGVSKGFYTLFGNNGLGLVTSLAVPNWFWEGDAVGTETVFTKSGRGRIPAFDMALRTQLLTKGAFSYSKAVCRSYKDFIPNHYVNGYLLTSYAKNQFGADVWDNILTNTYRFPVYPFSFSRNIKKITGLRTEDLYQKAFEDSKTAWQEQLKNVQETPAKSLKTNTTKYYTNYEYPQIMPDGRVLALKSGLSDIQTLVILGENEEEEELVELGLFNDAGTLSAVDTKIAWSEFHYDPRWGQKNYSVIKLYDINSDKITQLTFKSKLTAPNISPDGNKIVAVETSPENKNSIVILNAQTGEELSRIPNEANDFWVHPRWSDNDKFLVVRVSKNGKSIVEFEANSGKISNEFLTESGENLAYPMKNGDYIFYNSAKSGIDNIYALQISTGKRFQVTDRKFGAFNPCVSPITNELIFNDFTPLGHRVVKMELNPSNWKAVEESKDFKVSLFSKFKEKEVGALILNDIPTTKYEVSKYSKANIINPYSWGFVFGSSGNSFNVGLSSQDLLSTTSISTGYRFNPSEKTGAYYANVSLQAWYPQIDFAYSNGNRNTTIALDRATPIDSIRTDSWNQEQYNIGVSLPLNLTHSKFFESMNIGVNGSLTRISGYDFPIRYRSESFNGDISSMIYTFNYSRLMKRAPRDISSKWGQVISFYYRETLPNNKLEGGLVSFQASLFTPGFSKHHSIRLRASTQKQFSLKNADNTPNNKTYIFGSPTFFPRGYLYSSYENLSIISADYRFAFLDPDLALGRFLYLKRLKTNIFTDYGKGSTNYIIKNPANGASVPFDDAKNYFSVGIDLTAQFHFMRFTTQLEAGARMIYLPYENRAIFEPLVLDIGF
jgi:hypothetical protein